MKNKTKSSPVAQSILVLTGRLLGGCCLLFLVSSCQLSPSKSTSKSPSESPTPTTVDKQYTFSLPEIPAMMNTDEERARFIVSNFWENYNFKDSVLVKDSITEQVFGQYITLFGRTDSKTVKASVVKTLSDAIKVNHKTYQRFADLFERYLYDPNSPTRDDDYFIPVLEFTIQSPQIEPMYKIRPKKLLALAKKNRPGTQAANFTYITSDGKSNQLYHLKSDYVILLFNNPGCHSCKALKDEIETCDTFNRLIKGEGVHRLQILAIYPDADLKEWKKERYPSNWINGYNPKAVIKEKELYDLKAIPSLYLLDKNKRVIIKDALSWQTIEQWLLNEKTANS